MLASTYGHAMVRLLLAACLQGVLYCCRSWHIEGQDWVVSTGIPVSLEIHGVNLTSRNRLRVVGPNSTCDANGGHSTVLPFVVNCTTGCTQVTEGTSLALHTCASDNASVVAVRVQSAQAVEVEFDVVPGLQSRDRIILREVDCRSDCTEEHLASLRGLSAGGQEVLATSHPRRFVVQTNLSVAGGRLPSFHVSSGSWDCTSRARTQQLQSNNATAGLHVCGLDEAGTSSKIGQLSFVHPPVMPVAWLHPTATAFGVPAPVVVSFALGVDQWAINETGTTRLIVWFANTSQLQPLQVDGAMAFASSEIEPPEDQAACGRLIKELWSNDSHFPLPRGCGSRSAGVEGQLQLSFSPGNGLRVGVLYQMVFLAILSPVIGEESLQLWLMGSDPNVVHERGTPSLRQPLTAGAEFPAPRLAVFEVIGDSNGLVELKEEGPSFNFLLVPDVGEPIPPESRLRVFLSPLTAWAGRSSNCIARYELRELRSFNATQSANELRCQAFSLVEDLHFRNLLEITLPNTSLEASARLELRVGGLAKPAGFFPEQLAAELRLPDGSSPHYVLASGSLVTWLPTHSSTVAGIISCNQCGNAAPFRGSQTNQLLVRFALTATLRSVTVDGDAAGEALLSLRAPAGYILRQAQDAPGRLASKWGTGSLETSRWSCSGQTCVYSLQAYSAIWAGCWVDVWVTLSNPQTPLPANSSDNVWQLLSQAAGYHSTSLLAPVVEFAESRHTLQGEVFELRPGVAVLGLMSQVSIQPSRFAASPATGALVLNELQVFFTLEQGLRDGRILLVIPAGFTLSSSGVCADLQPAYYAADGEGRKMQTLLAVEFCTVDNRSNSLSIELLGELLAGQHYGFQTEVFNPRASPAEQEPWVLMTFTKHGHPVDASVNAGSSPPGIQESFNVYKRELIEVSAESLDEVNQSIVGMQVTYHISSSDWDRTARVQVWPLRTEVDILAAVRISAPTGYTWLLPDEGTGLDETMADLPGEIPVAEANLLRWPATRYLSNKTYGFWSWVRLPATASDLPSSNAFFVEFGYDQSWATGRRELAGRVHAPAIPALRNAWIDPASRVQGQMTHLTIQVETASHVPAGGALIVRSPVGFDFPAPCTLKEVPDLDLLPSIYPTPRQLYLIASCASRPFPAVARSSSQQVDLLIIAGAFGIPAGLYRFEVAAKNPGVRFAEGARGRDCSNGHVCWTFLSIADVDTEPYRELDWRITSTGYHVKESMPEARLHPALGRNDRPLQRNCLTFVFRLRRDVNTTGVLDEAALTLRGPIGFVFQQDCADSCDHSALASAVRAPLKNCQADYNSARLTLVAPGLEAGVLYAFGVEVANPLRTPVRNLWSLEVGTEASFPIPGFNVLTFLGLALQGLTCARGFLWPPDLRMANLVSLSFQPRSSQSQEGQPRALRIAAPPGFAFMNESNEACAELFLKQAGKAGVDMCSQGACRCALQAANVLLVNLQGSSKIVESEQYLLRLRMVAMADSNQTEAPWKLESYDDITAGAKLDVGEVASFHVCDPLVNLVIGRPAPTSAAGIAGADEDAGASLDLVLSVTFRHAVLLNDVLHIELPEGYTMADCSQIGWLQGSQPGSLPHWPPSPIPDQVEIACSPGNLTFHIAAQRAQVPPAGGNLQLQAGEHLAVRFATANPRRMVGKKYWQVRHLRQGVALEAGAWQSWQVVPQLWEVAISLASAAIGQRSSIVNVRFKAEGRAEQLKLQSMGPVQLDFSRASVTRGQILGSASSFMLVGTEMQDGELVELQVQNVDLPNRGGHCLFDLETRSRTGELVARRQRIDSGIQIPGHVIIRPPHLRSEYAPNLTLPWPPQLGSRVLLDLEVSFPEEVSAGQTLRIFGQTFTLLQGNFRLFHMETGILMPFSSSKTEDGALLAVVAEQGLRQDTWYRASAIALTPPTPQRSAVWSLEVLGTGLPISLGSVEAEVLLVPAYEVQVTSSRNPPLAEISIDVAASLRSTAPTRLAIVAPAGFHFLDDCLGIVSAKVARCSLTFVNGQEAADLVPHDEYFTDLQGLSLKVRTPAEAPAQSPWLIVGWIRGELVGWGEDKFGVGVTQMRSARVIYPASPDATAQLVVRLRLRDELAPGGSLQLLNPPELFLNCSGGELQEISLPIEGCTAEAGSLMLQLSAGLMPGIYAFAVGAQVPSKAPKTSTFSLLVLGPGGIVQDASTTIEGPQLQSELYLRPRPLNWTAAEAGQASSVVLGFKVRQQVKRGLVESVLITMAEHFEHTLESPQGIEILNTNLPLSRSHGTTGWADIRMADRVLIHLDQALPLPPGNYDFRIPITVPEELSAFNVWQLTLCKPGGTAEPCSVESPRALMTFPAAGFGLTMRQPEQPQMGGGARQPVFVALLAFRCLLCLLAAHQL